MRCCICLPVARCVRVGTVITFMYRKVEQFPLLVPALLGHWYEFNA